MKNTFLLIPYNLKIVDASICSLKKPNLNWSKDLSLRHRLIVWRHAVHNLAALSRIKYANKPNFIFIFLLGHSQRSHRINNSSQLKG